MIKLRVSFETQEEKEKLLQVLKNFYRFKDDPKEYTKEGPHKKIYVDLKNK